MKRFNMFYSRKKRNKVCDIKWIKMENIFFDRGYIDLSVKSDIYIRLRLHGAGSEIYEKLDGFIDVVDILFSKKDNMVSLEYFDVDVNNFFKDETDEEILNKKKKNIIIFFSDRGWERLFE